ncbi:uncharacterized protein BO80DRAFT_9889 [Aspergillus ibericus CBS 121593]|uniref:Uncharacterized protein n=1 Tax=Aspergillus ibericus CBS 121593 TaxID=1448316 RepID=A0A395HJE1_9EURO|nr:hypothetical protein BO80DRAFT_9889 [Aspergillus ibericus CBS 121593]RAL06364.1 hypothetical protein BO80DRAFT_9889 [Aspergillus ibericus CBS 121593]
MTSGTAWAGLVTDWMYAFVPASPPPGEMRPATAGNSPGLPKHPPRRRMEWTCIEAGTGDQKEANLLQQFSGSGPPAASLSLTRSFIDFHTR